MKPSKNKRSVLYNRKAESPPEEIHTWYFLVINEPKMIDRIKQGLFTNLQPIEEFTEYKDDTIRGQDLRIYCFSFQSPQNDLEEKTRKDIYNGKWKKDDELYYREGLDNLIDRRSREITEQVN